MNRKIAVISVIVIITIALSIALSIVILQLHREPLGLNTEMATVQIMSFTDNQMTLNVKNTGFDTITVSSAKINNSTVTIEPFTLEANTEKTVMINGQFVNGTSYKVTLFSLHDTPFYETATAVF